MKPAVFRGLLRFSKKVAKRARHPLAPVSKLRKCRGVNDEKARGYVILTKPVGFPLPQFVAALFPVGHEMVHKLVEPGAVAAFK